MDAKIFRDILPDASKPLWDRAIVQENYQQAASVLAHAGKVDDAITFCSQNKLFADALDIATQYKKYDAAISICKQTNNAAKLADILLLKGEKEQAASLLAKLQQYEQAAKIYFSIGQYEQAAVLYAQIKQYMNAIMCYQKSGNTEKQLDMQLAAFENDLEMANGDLQAVSVSRMMAIYAAKILLDDPGSSERAILILNKADALESTANELYQEQRFVAAAICFEHLQEWDRALEAYKQANKPNEAVDLCKRLQDDDLEIDTLIFFGLYFKLGFKYANLKRYDEALSVLKKIDSNSPEYPSALELQGDIYCKLKRYQDSILCYESLFWLNLSDDKICRIAYKAGYSYEALEDFPNSLKNYQKVYDIDPTFHEISQTLDQVAGKLRQKTSSLRQSGGQTVSQKGEITAGRVLRRPPTTERKRTPSIYIGETEVPAVSLERYKIIEEVAHGGMGTVYKATDTLLMRTVALKVLSQKLKDNQVALEYFMREARASAALTHINIVTVYDIGYFDDNVYMAMEFIEGQTLKTLVQKTGNFTTKLLVQIATHACRGLQYAHENGIIHRDVKSSNMMLAKRSKTLKILDLGLAKILNEQQDHGSTQAIGTPYYMSPEQVLGNDIDARSDIYSLGVTLFELATGVLPFVKGDLPYKHVHEPPPLPSSFNPKIHPKIEDMILKMMQKSPDDRYASCNEIIADLKSIDLSRESGD